MATKTATSFEERVARVLVEGGFVTTQQLEKAREAASKKQSSLLDTLIEQGSVGAETLGTVLSFQLRIPIVDLKHVKVDNEALRLVPEDYARQHSILPVVFDPDGSLRVATKSPNDFQLSSELASRTGRQIKFVLAIGGDLRELIDRTYSSGVPRPAPASEPETEDAPTGGPPAIRTAPRVEADGLGGQDVSALPAVQAVEMVTLQGVKRHASDIHFVPTVDCSKILFRVDGVLQQVTVVPLTLHESMVSRIKVLADMDISERRRPQDGSFSLQFGDRTVDFRVSAIATAWGEMMVVRILDRSGGVLTLEDLGLESTSLLVWRQLLGLPYGMLMVSGPTGSGKTTTLYASIVELIRNRGNIMTIEDPIEYRIDGMNQIEVNRPAGIDFAAGLRSIMRLDPDVILVGEIRDHETAKVAVDAALTGHLVLASIHANDAASAVVRLLDLGVEPYLVATAVAGTMSVRLVRKVCSHCGAPSEIGVAEAMAYEQEMQEAAEEFMVGQGCNFCNNTGYSGRIGVFEVLPVSESIRKLIGEGAPGQLLRDQALAEGMIPLRRAGFVRAKHGITTVTEVLRKVFFID